MRTLTLEQLSKHRACRSQVALFKKHFGESVVVTEELAASLSDIFDFGWASRTLLSGASQTEYSKVVTSASDKYIVECVAACTEFKKVCASAGVEYVRLEGSVWAEPRAEFEEVCAPAQAEYTKACEGAWAEFDKVRAATFAKLYNADQT